MKMCASTSQIIYPIPILPPFRFLRMASNKKEKKKNKPKAMKKSVTTEIEKKKVETRVPGFGDRRKRPPR